MSSWRAFRRRSHFVAELLNVPVDPDQAYVGRNAFAHKGGMHVAGIAADARTFEHMDPEVVGNSRAVLPSELSGKATIVSRAEELGLELDDTAAREVVEELKQREHEGYHYEAAEASFDLLLRRKAGEYEPLFRLESFRVITEMREDGRSTPRRSSRSGSAASATCPWPKATARSTRSTRRCAARSTATTRTSRTST